jgi:hypothetical protein
VGAWVGLNNPKLTALTVLGGLAFSFVLQKWAYKQFQKVKIS